THGVNDCTRSPAYAPKTELGKRLRACRARYIPRGRTLLNWDYLDRESATLKTPNYVYLLGGAFKCLRSASRSPKYLFGSIACARSTKSITFPNCGAASGRRTN